MEYFWEPKSVQHSLADFIFISGIMVTVATARYTAVQLKTVGQNPAQKEYWQNHRGTRFHHCHHHGCTWTRGMIDFLLTLHLPCDEPRVAVNKVSLFEPRNDSLKSFLKCVLWFCDFFLLIDLFQQYPDKILHFFHIMCAAHGKLSQPNFSPISGSKLKDFA